MTALHVVVASVSVRLRPQVVSDSCLSASEAPAVSNAAYCSRSLLLVVDITGRLLGQPGQRFKTPCETWQTIKWWSSPAPTAGYEKLRRIWNPSNLNGSADMSSSACSTPFSSPASVHSSTFLSPHGPGLPVHSAEQRPVRRRRSSHALSGPFAVVATGLYWRVISQIEISFQSSQQGTAEARPCFGPRCCVFSLFANRWNGTAPLSAPLTLSRCVAQGLCSVSNSASSVKSII